MEGYKEEIEKCAKMEGFAPCLYAEVIISHFGVSKEKVVKDVLEVRASFSLLKI